MPARGTSSPVSGTLTLVGNNDRLGWVWEYRCDCGQTYRVSAVESGTRFWPGNGARFSPHSLAVGSACPRCGAQLTLAGRSRD